MDKRRNVSISLYEQKQLVCEITISAIYEKSLMVILLSVLKKSYGMNKNIDCMWVHHYHIFIYCILLYKGCFYIKAVSSIYPRAIAASFRSETCAITSAATCLQNVTIKTAVAH